MMPMKFVSEGAAKWKARSQPHHLFSYVDIGIMKIRRIAEKIIARRVSSSRRRRAAISALLISATIE